MSREANDEEEEKNEEKIDIDAMVVIVNSRFVVNLPNRGAMLIIDDSFCNKLMYL